MAALGRLVGVALSMLLAAGTGAARAGGDAARGLALYSGAEVLSVVEPDGRAHPMPQAACVQCHRRSGLGSFEGSLAAPPITGPTLFRPHDRDTFVFFRGQRRDRIRPAYDEASLQAMLAGGLAPDGHAVRAPMPRYAIDARAAADLAAYLRTLGSEPAAGIDAEVVRIASVVAPGTAAHERATLEAVIGRFVALKNAQPRHEARRAQQSGRNHEMAMNTKFRRWQHEVWELEGEPDGWAAQLERRQRERPVFALVGGLGGERWDGVDAFCERARVPCLLPLVDAAPRAGFYAVHFHGGRAFDLSLAAEALHEAGVRRVQLWAEAAARDAATEALAAHGLSVDDGPAAQGVLSLLPPPAHLARLAASTPARVVAWAPGRHAPGAAEWAAAAAPLAAGVFVAPWRPHEAASARPASRAEAWLRQQRLDGLDGTVAAATLQALTVFGEAFSHIDFGYSREYLVELLEHGLENMLVYGPYERLAISPGQRIGSKGSQVAAVHDGARGPWRWRTAQNREMTVTDVSALPSR